MNVLSLLAMRTTLGSGTYSLVLLQGKIVVDFPLHHCGHNHIGHCQGKLFKIEEIMKF